MSTINKIGIPFSLWKKKNADGKGSGAYKWPSLIGSAIKKLMELLPAQLEQDDILFPETKLAVIHLWSDFHALYKIIRDYKPKAEQYPEVAQKTKEFMNLFCSLGDKRLNYTEQRITPYMHTIPDRIPIIIQKFSTIKQFKGQGVEKNNDAKRIFSESDKWDGARDVLQLGLRQLALQGHEREKKKFEKRKNDNWEDDIVETLKKRQRSQVVD